MNRLVVSTQLAAGDSLVLFAKMLDSVSFADAVTVYNMERTDTAAQKLFRDYQVKVINVKTPQVVEQIRANQVREARGDWVLIMDFDEIITQALATEILAVCSMKSSAASAYFIPRENFSLGNRIMHGGWGDDYVMRLIKKSEFVDWGSNIHALPTFEGSSGKLKNYMEHHKDENLSYIVNKTNRYSESEAKQYLEGGLPLVTPLTLLRKLTLEFFRRAILKKGLLDGDIGLIQSLYQGFSVFVSYAKLYELQIKKDIEKPL